MRSQQGQLPGARYLSIFNWSYTIRADGTSLSSRLMKRLNSCERSSAENFSAVNVQPLDLKGFYRLPIEAEPGWSIQFTSYPHVAHRPWMDCAIARPCGSAITTPKLARHLGQERVMWLRAPACAISSIFDRSIPARGPAPTLWALGSTLAGTL